MIDLLPPHTHPPQYPHSAEAEGDCCRLQMISSSSKRLDRIAEILMGHIRFGDLLSRSSRRPAGSSVNQHRGRSQHDSSGESARERAHCDGQVSRDAVEIRTPPCEVQRASRKLCEVMCRKLTSSSSSITTSSTTSSAGKSSPSLRTGRDRPQAKLGEGVWLTGEGAQEYDRLDGKGL